MGIRERLSGKSPDLEDNSLGGDPGSPPKGKLLGKMSREETVRLMIGLGVAVVLIGAYTFFIIPRREESVRAATIAQVDVNAMPKVSVVWVKEGQAISKYTQLTDQIIADKLEVVQVPASFAVQDVASDTMLVKDQVITVDLVSHSQLSSAQLTGKDDWFGKFDRLREFRINNTVAGQVQTGNLVDIVVEYKDGDYDVVAAKKKITSIKASGVLNQTTINPDGTPAAVQLGETNDMVFSVDEEEYARLTNARNDGDLMVRIYIDETQEPSKITYSAANAARHKSPTANTNNDTTTSGNTNTPASIDVSSGTN